MNHVRAKRIADVVKNEEILQMLLKAQKHITGWEEPSKLNKGISKGICWNILTKDFNVKNKLHPMVKINLLKEYGEYLEGYGEEPPPKKRPTKVPHQEPIFLKAD
jgi:hypothetical protein